MARRKNILDEEGIVKISNTVEDSAQVVEQTVTMPITDESGIALAEVHRAVASSPEVTVPKAICDMDLSDDEKLLVVRSRVSTIIKRTQIPFIPALVTYKENDSPSAPPLKALVDNVDHQCLQEAWDFYSTNVHNPNAVQFLEIVRSATRTPERVYQRVVEIKLF